MIQGILFDKDGTLLRFEELWLDAARHVIYDFCRLNRLPENKKVETLILKAMGVENETIRQDGALAYMTYEQIGAVVVTALHQAGMAEKISTELAGRQMSVLFETVLAREQLACIPTCDLKNLFKTLKARDIKTGLATADNLPVTEKCLKQLEIMEEFDFVGCDDGILKPKPEPDMFEAFCGKQGLKPEQVAVIGDTVNDMLFAKKCKGIAVGTLSGIASREELEEAADIIVETPFGILEYL